MRTSYFLPTPTTPICVYLGTFFRSGNFLPKPWLFMVHPEQLFSCYQVNSLVEASLPNNCSPPAASSSFEQLPAASLPEQFSHVSCPAGSVPAGSPAKKKDKKR